MNKNKILSAGLIAILLLLFWVHLAENGQVNSQPELDPVKNETVIRLLFGHNTPENSALHQAALRFANEVKRKSYGKITVDVYPSQQLGNDHQMVEMARSGDLDILLTPTAKMSVPVPAMQYADLPFMFPSREDAYSLLDGEPGKLLLRKLRKIGLVGVTFWENGFKHFTGNRPFRMPGDFSGKKIRVMKSRIIMDQFKAFNAEPVPIDFHSTRQALLDGVVDGQENPLIAIVSMGFHEVQSDLVLSEHAYLGYVFSISEKTVNRLPPETGQMLIDTAKEVTPWEREETQRREQKLLETIKKSGVKVHRLNAEEKKQFALATSHIAAQYEDLIGSDILSKTQEILLNKYGPDASTKQQIVIGINADLSLDGRTAGLAIKRGATLAVKEINAQGGVLGKPLKIIARDHRVSPGQSHNNVQTFIQREDVVAILGGLHGSMIQDDMSTVQQAKIPYLIPWSATASLTENGYDDNFMFRLSLDDDKASIKLANEVMSQGKHPAILVENSTWGRRNLDRFQKYFSQSGIRIATAIVYNRGQKTFKKELLEVDAAGADSLLMVANSKEGSIIIRELTESPRPLPVISHWGIQGGTFFEDTQDALSEINLQFIQSFNFNTHRNFQSIKLKKSYMKDYVITGENDIKAHAGIAQAYDLVKILAIAIRQAGTTDRSQVKLALENLPAYDGVIKRFKRVFTAKNHEALSENDYFMARFDFNGQVIPVTD